MSFIYLLLLPLNWLLFALFSSVLCASQVNRGAMQGIRPLHYKLASASREEAVKCECWKCMSLCHLACIELMEVKPAKRWLVVCKSMHGRRRCISLQCIKSRMTVSPTPIWLSFIAGYGDAIFTLIFETDMAPRVVAILRKLLPPWFHVREDQRSGYVTPSSKKCGYDAQIDSILYRAGRAMPAATYYIQVRHASHTSNITLKWTHKYNNMVAFSYTWKYTTCVQGLIFSFKFMYVQANMCACIEQSIHTCCLTIEFYTCLR